MYTPTGTLNQPRKMSFNPFVRKGDVIEATPSPCSPPQKESPTSQKGVSSSATQRTLPLRARETISKTKKLAKEIRKIIKTKRTSTVTDANVYRVFDDSLNQHMLVKVEIML